MDEVRWMKERRREERKKDGKGERQRGGTRWEGERIREDTDLMNFRRYHSAGPRALNNMMRPE